MSAPTVRQVDGFSNTAAAASSISVSRTAPTLAGSRLYLMVGVNDNSVVVSASVSDPNYVPIPSPVGGKATRTAGVDRMSLWVFEFQQAGIQGNGSGVTVSFTNAGSPWPVWANLFLVEVTGADPSAAAERMIITSGSATAIALGPYSAPPTNSEILHLALIANLNFDSQVDPGGGLLNGFTQALQMHNKTTGGDPTTANSAVYWKRDTTAVNESFTVNLTGSGPPVLARNYVGLMIAVPAAPPGAGSFFGMDDTNDGRIHRGCSLHYYPGGFLPTGATAADGLANAQAAASLFDIIVGNSYVYAAGGSKTGFDKFAGHTDAMLAIKPNIQIGQYNKSIEISEGKTAFPNDYYAHQSPWPTGAKITIFNPNIFVGQSNVVAGQTAFADLRGWIAHSFKEERARLVWWNVDQYNLLVPGGAFNMGYLDTFYSSSYKGIQVDPATNIPYTRPNWINQQVFPVGDETMNRGSGRPVWANVISTQDQYFTGSPTSGSGLDHCNGGVAENWIHSNYSDVTIYQSETSFQRSADMHIDADGRGKGVWCVVNIANKTAKGSVPNGWVTPSAAQMEKQRRYSMATYMFAKRHKSWFEFVENVNVLPWLEDHPYYHLDLGVPLDNWASAISGKIAGIYYRRFQRGIALINPTLVAATYVYDRDYNDPAVGQPGPGIIDYSGTAGTAQLLQPNQALILVTPASGPPNLNAPSGTFISPGATTSNNPVLAVVNATDVDGDGIAQVTFSYLSADGITTVNVAGLNVGGNWQAEIPLVQGSNTITAIITDGNTTPRSTTITTSVDFEPGVAGSGLPQPGGDSYDVYLDGLGLMLYRDNDDSVPNRTFKAEAVDLTFSPVFIDRTNVSGDLGDNTQAFFMTFVQKDWSGGMGQKYLRQDTDSERSFWDCRAVEVAANPGSVRLGVKQGNNVPPGAQTNWCNGEFYSHPGLAATAFPPQQGLFRLDNSGTSAAVVYHYNSDGSANWLTQHTTGATAWNDCVDLCVGDDDVVYALEGGTGNTATIHRINMPGTATTLAWDNSTGITGASALSIAYFQGKVYVADRKAVVKQVNSLGSVATGATVHDFGGGHVIDMISTGDLLYILYKTSHGDVRVYSYDGTNPPTQAAQLPAGWRYQQPHQSSMDAFGNASSVNKVHAMAFADGVLYVSGLIPAVDYVQSQRRTTNYRQAVWFLAGANTGMIWQSEVMVNDWRRASGGALTVIRGDCVVWLDGTNNKLMKYDPAQGAVMCAGIFSNKNPTNINDDQVVAGALVATDVTLVVTSASTSTLVPGTVLTTATSTERVLVVNAISATQYTIIRGYQDTTPSDATFPNGATLLVDPPLPAPTRIAYDSYNDRLMIVWYGSGPAGWAAQSALQGHRLSFFELSYGPGFLPADAGLVVSSAFDFNSSLEKLFASVAIDGQQTQLPNRTDEVPGTFDIYYKLDGTFSSVTDAGVQIAQLNATPGVEYPILAAGRSVSIGVVLNPGTPSPSQPISQGPVLTRLSVKGVPVLPAFRNVSYQVALFNDMPTKSGIVDPNKAIDLVNALMAKIEAAAPVTVTDETMPDGVTMVFQPENCRLREIRIGEWIGYIQLREI